MADIEGIHSTFNHTVKHTKGAVNIQQRPHNITPQANTRRTDTDKTSLQALKVNSASEPKTHMTLPSISPIRPAYCL